MRTLLFILLLFLTACKKEAPIISDNFVYTHPFVSRDYLPIVKGTINGKNAYFLLDTGASISILNSKEVSQYGVILGHTKDIVIGGYGGTTNDLIDVSNVDIKLGDLNMTGEFSAKDIQYLVKPVESNTGYKISGIIGNNNIAGHGLIVDFENNYLLKRNLTKF